MNGNNNHENKTHQHRARYRGSFLQQSHMRRFLRLVVTP